MPDPYPLISVIIPTYNRGWIVREAIDSVLKQDYPNFELIVVDDGSTDRTGSILSSYAGRLKVIRQPRQGVSAARNRGIDAAAGALVAFLDSDDYWLERKLSVQAAYFQDCPQVSACQTEEIWVRNGVRVNPGRRHRKPSGDIFEPSLKLCLVSPSAVMLRRAVFDRCGYFDEALPACEDYDLWLRISCRMPVHLIDQPLIVKRGGHDDQLSRQPSLDRYRIQALVKLLSGGQLNPGQEAAAIKVLGEKCRIYIAGCLKRGRMSEADTYRGLGRQFGLPF
jgi:glycosyltransferase involved in cell wall biosynthesis